MVRPFASRKNIYPAKLDEKNIKDEIVLELT